MESQEKKLFLVQRGQSFKSESILSIGGATEGASLPFFFSVRIRKLTTKELNGLFLIIFLKSVGLKLVFERILLESSTLRHFEVLD